jgi:hypothetical protein
VRPGSPSLHVKQPPNKYADSPVILKDDESDTPKPVPDAAAISVSVNTSADLASELSKIWLRDPCKEISSGYLGMNETRNRSQRSHDYLSTEEPKSSLYQNLVITLIRGSHAGIGSALVNTIVWPTPNPRLYENSVIM